MTKYTQADLQAMLDAIAELKVMQEEFFKYNSKPSSAIERCLEIAYKELNEIELSLLANSIDELI